MEDRKTTIHLYRESHCNGLFLGSTGLAGGSGRSQGKAVNVRYGTRHLPRSTMEVNLQQTKNKKENSEETTPGSTNKAQTRTTLLRS